MKACLSGSDDRFGPQVNVQCRSFDFTLLFEDTVLSLLPAAIFLLLAPIRLLQLRRTSIKLQSRRLVILKTASLSALLILHVLFLVERIRTPTLHTQVSLASSVVELVAITLATLLSFLEDQRSVGPSYLLVIYFSASTILSLPRLRTLWILPGDSRVCRSLWTAIFTLTITTLFTESLDKSSLISREYQSVTKEEKAGFWGRSFFIWILPLFRLGMGQNLQVKDLAEVDQDLQGDGAGTKLRYTWDKSPVAGKYRLVKAVFRAYWWPFLSAVIPRLCLLAFQFCQTYLIQAAVTFLSDASVRENKRYGPALTGASAMIYLGIAISTAVTGRQKFRTASMARAGLISLIYEKTAHLQAADLRDKKSITLIETDVDTITAALPLLVEVGANTIQIALGLWLLERQIGVACVTPAVIVLAGVLGSIPVSAAIGKAQGSWVQKITKRITVTAITLGDIKSVKMLGLTDSVYSLITSLRDAEIKTSETFRKWIVAQVGVSSFPAEFAPMATFTVYIIIAVVHTHQSLLSAQAFTSLSLITLVTGPLAAVIQNAAAIQRSLVCFGRIEDYLCKESLAPSNADVSPGKQSLIASNVQQTPPEKEPAVSSHKTPDLTLEKQSNLSDSLLIFQDACFAWPSETTNVLHHLNIDIPAQSITIIAGAVGSGKSALLQSILGETKLTEGSFTTSKSSLIAYCAQDAWIMNETIRDIITGSQEFDEKWYRHTLWSCALTEDLRRLPSGDFTKAGNNGMNLSGGQKQRIALARAVYSRLDFLLLDDIFAGLDSRTLTLIATRLFGENGYFRSMKRSVVVATHTQLLFSYADQIFTCDGGMVTKDPTLANKLSTTKSTNSPDSVQEVHEDSPSDPEVTSSSNSETPARQATSAPGDGQPSSTSSEDKKRRSRDWSSYEYYLSSAGKLLMSLFILSMFSLAFVGSFSTIWLDWWADANEHKSNKSLGTYQYMGVYILLGLLAVLFLGVGAWILLVNVINNTATRIHAEMLKATFYATFDHLQTTDRGSTINRFSQDINLIDMSLPLNAINFGAGVADTVVKTIVLCVVGRYLTAAIPFLFAILYAVQHYYLKTSRQVRLLDIEAKAPMMSHFLSSTQGITTIRAFGWVSHFTSKNEALLNYSQRPVYTLSCIQTCLELALDLIVAALAVILVGSITAAKSQFNPGSIGVTLNLLLSFAQNIRQTMSYGISLETSLGAVTRVAKYLKETPSELRSNTRKGVSFGQGSIKFDNFTASYNATLPDSLININLQIRPGEKVAVCGPSGSGKTSIIMSLLQMMDVRSGTVSINDIDLSEMDCEEVRSKINTIPQDPFFLPDTVRRNLDPREETSDDSIRTAIEKVGLSARLNDLNAQFTSSDWSVGEKQLLAVARALISKSPILVLDEAASSMDPIAEALMQKIIEQEFSTHTIISVLHRFRYIEYFDRVVVMKQGVVVESDSPKELLGRDSEFRRLWETLQ